MAEPGGTRALENSGNYTTERGGNDRAEMGWKLTTEPGWIKNGIRTEKTGRKCSQRDYPHEQLCNIALSRNSPKTRAIIRRNLGAQGRHLLHQECLLLTRARVSNKHS